VFKTLVDYTRRGVYSTGSFLTFDVTTAKLRSTVFYWLKSSRGNGINLCCVLATCMILPTCQL